MSNNVDLLLEEYKLGKQTVDGYFKNSYNVISFTLILYGVALTFLGGSNDGNSSIIWCAFMLFLPGCTYILGLFYAYNSLVITKHGNYCIYLEMLIKLSFFEETKRECKFQGWDIIAKKYGGGFILTYGTVLIFYLVIPIFDFFYVYKIQEQSIIIFDNENLNCIFKIAPIFMCAIYFFFMIIIIIKTCKMYWSMKKMNIQYRLNGQTLNIRPSIKR